MLRQLLEQLDAAQRQNVVQASKGEVPVLCARLLGPVRETAHKRGKWATHCGPAVGIKSLTVTAPVDTYLTTAVTIRPYTAVYRLDRRSSVACIAAAWAVVGATVKSGTAHASDDNSHGERTMNLKYLIERVHRPSTGHGQ